MILPPEQYACCSAAVKHEEFNEDLKKLFSSHPEDFAVRQKMAKLFIVQCDFTGKVTQPSIVTKLSSLTLFPNCCRPPSGARIPIKQQNEMNISKFWIGNVTRILPSEISKKIVQANMPFYPSNCREDLLVFSSTRIIKMVPGKPPKDCPLYAVFSTYLSTCVARAACFVFCSISLTAFLFSFFFFYKFNRHLCHGAY